MEENCDMQIYSIIVLNLLLKDHRKHMQKKAILSEAMIIWCTPFNC